MSYQRTSDSEWEWQDGSKHYAVRIFPKTHKLIWSSWTETSEAPIFDEGFVQTFEEFLRGNPLPSAPPQALIEELRRAITGEAKPKRGLFDWLRRS